MKCRQAKRLISRYVDDELDPDEKRDFDRHIQGCASCREELEQTLSLQQMFASAGRYSAPYGFATRVMANLRDKERSRPRGLVPVKPLFVRAAQVAVALVIMAIGSVSGNLLLAERTPPAGQTAVQETFSLDFFQTTPRDSMAGIYVGLMRPGHEK